jgi:hypothetical protein
LRASPSREIVTASGGFYQKSYPLVAPRSIAEKASAWLLLAPSRKITAQTLASGVGRQALGS